MTVPPCIAMEVSISSHRIRFGRFEVDPESGELFKDGRRIRLQGQPVQILLMLLAKPGHLVTREELQQRLWPKDTFVDFDYGLNAAIKRLRESLGDSADEPLYIETLPRRGYRFIFPVEGMPAIAPRLASSPSPSLILRLWQAVTQSPASPPGAEGKTPLPAPTEIAAAATEPERPEEPAQKSEFAPRSLEPGQQLGSYEVLCLLGRGGMGEVYMARDSRLDRQVALKVLPDEFTKDPERLARFEREAKLLASLNHPNVAAIYGLEEVDGHRFLVLELVEGETLAEHLEKAPLPIETALGVCRQIAEGLEAAHEKGIIHRDLKPANIKITPEEKVKILDFGLAKAHPKDGAIPGLPKSQVISDEIESQAIIVGSAAYMSPEQASGKPIDKRTDIWAFGCVLFECLTGKRTFEGETTSEMLAAILKTEPDWPALPEETPAAVRSLLRRCLQKDPRERLHDIADARIEIGEQIDLPEEPVRVSQRFSPGRLITAGVSMLIVGVLIGLAMMNSLNPGTAKTSQPVVRFPVRLEPGYWLDGWRDGRKYGFEHPTRTATELSSDGRFIVYGAARENSDSQGKPRLYIRRFDQLEARVIPRTEGGMSPFLSPDDQSVGFWADGKLMKLSLEGGVPVPLTGVASPFGFSWGADNQIVFAAGESTGLSMVSADGGSSEVLTVLDKSREYSHRLPHYLPHGRGIIFTIMSFAYDMNPRVGLLDLATRKWRILVEDAADARYIASGHLAFLRRGTLMVMPFNPNRLEITGQPVPAVGDVMQALNSIDSPLHTGAGQFSISSTGSLVFAPGGIPPDMENSLVWVDHHGKAEPISPSRAWFFAPRVSPNGQWIAYTIWANDRQVWVYDLSRGTSTKLTREGISSCLTWTPDSRHLVFDWMMKGRPDLYRQPIDASSPMERLTTREYDPWPGSLSRDGQTLAFVETHSGTDAKLWGTDWDIMLLDMRDRQVTPFLNSPSGEGYPEISPDGRWMAYVTNETGRLELYVRPFSGRGGKWQISNEGAWQPLWARDGKQLFYRWGNKVWAVDVRTDAGFSASKPRVLFDQSGYEDNTPVRGWDISPDGQRFLMVKLEERKPQPVTELILVQNWFEELKRLCPTGKN